MIEKTVKINNIRNLSDARYCAAMGVSLLGFNIDSYDVKRSFQFFQSVSEWVSGVDFVAEIEQITEETNALEKFKYLEISDLSIIENPIVNSGNLIVNLSGKKADQKKVMQSSLKYEYIIIDSDFQPHETIFMEESIHEKILINLDTLSIDRIKRILEKYPKCGFCITSESEDRPGFKNYDKLEEIFNILEEN